MPVIKLAFLDVGQGDTTIISCPDTHEAIVVDCVDSVATLAYLKREHITHLRGVIITHLHADHYKGAADLLDNCGQEGGNRECEVLATSEAVYYSASSKRANSTNQWPLDGNRRSTMYEEPSANNSKIPLARLYNWCRVHKEKCKPISTVSNVSFPIQGTIAQSLKVLHPPHFDYQKLKTSGLNNISIVLRVTGTGASALLTGDLEPLGWQYLKDENKDQIWELKSDVLKFPHHGGSWNKAQTDDLLSVVQPSIVTISVGSNNTFDHPHSDVFAALENRCDLRLFCTQATDKCQTSVLSERENIILQFQNQSRKDYSFFISPRDAQCPCSGSVIVELRDQPLIIQPNIAFHESLINIHFKNHKCYIDASETRVEGESSISVIDT
jgi:competence protein ComEC